MDGNVVGPYASGDAGAVATPGSVVPAAAVGGGLEADAALSLSVAAGDSGWVIWAPAVDAWLNVPIPSNSARIVRSLVNLLFMS